MFRFESVRILSGFKSPRKVTHSAADEGILEGMIHKQQESDLKRNKTLQDREDKCDCSGVQRSNNDEQAIGVQTRHNKNQTTTTINKNSHSFKARHQPEDYSEIKYQSCHRVALPQKRCENKDVTTMIRQLTNKHTITRRNERN